MRCGYGRGKGGRGPPQHGFVRGEAACGGVAHGGVVRGGLVRRAAVLAPTSQLRARIPDLCFCMGELLANNGHGQRQNLYPQLPLGPLPGILSATTRTLVWVFFVLASSAAVCCARRGALCLRCLFDLVNLYSWSLNQSH